MKANKKGEEQVKGFKSLAACVIREFSAQAGEEARAAGAKCRTQALGPTMVVVPHGVPKSFRFCSRSALSTCLQRNRRGVKRARLMADLLTLPFKLASPTLEQSRPGPL